MVNLLTEIPALYLAALLLTAVQKYFFLAIFGATFLAMCFLVYIMPRLSCFAVTYRELPAE